MNSFFDSMYAVLGYPFGYVLRFIYTYITAGNYGLSLILFTLFARLLMVPTTISQQKSTIKTQRIQPKLRRINEKYKGDQQKIQEETQALYQREGYNPMNAGCLPLLVQLPIIYGLIGVIYHPLKYALLINADAITALSDAAKALSTELATKNTRFIELYVIEHINELQNVPGVSEAIYQKIQNFSFTFCGIPLGQVPDFKNFNILWVIPALSFLSSLASGIYSTIRSKRQNPAAAKNPTAGCMMLGMPLFSLYFTFQFPAGIGIYWIASNIFSFITMIIIGFTHSPSKLIARDMVDETVARRSKEAYTKRLSEIKNKNAE